jgi:hypothetical protein
MSSLAFYAAPIEGSTENNSETTIDKKRDSRMNKTLKRRSSNRSHVQAMIDQIHQNTGEDEPELANFAPPGPPESAGAQRRESRENGTGAAPAGYSAAEEGTFQDAPVTTEAFDNLPGTASEDYYQQVVPFYNKVNEGSVQNKDELLTKLNYMIHLLEEQQEERTGHVTEEVVLYSFLGVFIIFVVDSFARAGKYVR